MPSWIVPSDTHVPGDSGHTTDHDHIADDLTLLANAVSAINGVRSVSTTYTVVTTDTVIVCNATSAGFAVTLPDATTCNGRVLSFVILTGSGHTVTLTPHAGQTVNGFSSFTLSINNWACPIVSDGSNWHVEAAYGFTDNNVLDDGNGNMTIAGAINMSSHKITSLTNGSSASDAAAFGQTLGGGNAAPMTTKGDLVIMNGTPVPARLAVGAVNQILGVASGMPAWQAAWTRQVQTANAGYTMVNGTGTIVTFTTPNDGNFHSIQVTGLMRTTSTMTGGAVNLSFTDPSGAAVSFTGIITGGFTAPATNTTSFNIFAAPNTAVTISQGTAMTAGAAKVWADLWCA